VKFERSRASHLKLMSAVARSIRKRGWYWHLHLPMCHLWERPSRASAEALKPMYKV